jgi:hypothetical protein
MERQSDKRRRAPFYKRGWIKVRLRSPSLSFSVYSCIVSRYAHSRGATISGGRGWFPDLIGQFFLGSRSEFRNRRKHLLRRWVNKGMKKGRGLAASDLPTPSSPSAEDY